MGDEGVVALGLESVDVVFRSQHLGTSNGQGYGRNPGHYE